MLSLSADDVVTARAVRPAAVGEPRRCARPRPHRRARWRRSVVSCDPRRLRFSRNSCQSLSGFGAADRASAVGARGDADGDADDAEAADDRCAHATVRRGGCRRAGRLRLRGADGRDVEQPRTARGSGATVRPQTSDLRDAGVVDASGAQTAFGSVWLEQARRERERAAPAARGPSTSTSTTTTRIFPRACTSSARPGNAARANTLLCCDEHRNGGKSSSFGASIAVFAGSRC